MRILVTVSLCLLALLAGSALAEETIVIGVNMELTGYSSDLGTEHYRGVEIAHRLQPFASANGKTYPIELVVCDNQTQREKAANCAARLIEQRAVGMVGLLSSTMSLAASPIAQDSGVTLVSTGSTNPVTTQIGEYIFRIPFTDDYQGTAIAGYAYDVLGARRAVIFRQSDDDYSVEIANVIEEEFQRRGGQVQVQSVDQATLDFSVQLNEARRFNPDILVTTAFCPLSGPLVRQSRAANFHQQWVGSDSLDAPSCAQLGGEAFEGVLFTGFPDLSQLPPDALERATSFQETYFQLYPESLGFGGVTLAGSDAYGALVAAIEAALTNGAQPSDLAAFRVATRDALGSLEDFPGMTGELTYAGTDGTPARRSIGFFSVDDVTPDGDYQRVARGHFVIEADGVVYHP